MEAYLEFLGMDFDAEAALVGSPLREHAEIFRRGENSGLHGKVHENSGFQIWVGGDEGVELDRQIAEAMTVLADDAEEIRRIRSFAGVEKAHLRFGEIWAANIVGHFIQLPNHLLLACGQLGLDVELCEYLGDQKSPKHDDSP